MAHRYSNSLYALLSPMLPQRVSLPPLSVFNEAEPPPSYEPTSPVKHKRAISSPPAALPAPSAAAALQQHQRAVTTLSAPATHIGASSAAASQHDDITLSQQLPSSTVLASSPSSSTLTTGLPSPHTDVASLSASFHSLVLQLHHRWLQQHAVNTTNNTLHAFNFILHYASISRTVTVHKQQQHLQQQLHQHTQLLAAMEDRVAEAEGAVGQLAHSMELMTEDAAVQHQQLSQLQVEVQQQRERVADAMEMYEAKLAEQAEMMERQERSLERLLLVRLRLDFGVDAVIVALAFYLARLPLLRLLLFTVARQALPVRVQGLSGSVGGLSVRGRRELVVGVGQLVVFAAVVARARSWAVEKGLHNMVGSYSRYAAMALQTMQAAAYRMAEKQDDMRASEEMPDKAEVAEKAEPHLKVLQAPAVELPRRPAGSARPASPTHRSSAVALSSSASDSPAAVALSLAGGAVTDVVSSVGSTVFSAGQLVGRLLTFGSGAPDELKQPQRQQQGRR